jgi:hypothetical protein
VSLVGLPRPLTFCVVTTTQFPFSLEASTFYSGFPEVEESNSLFRFVVQLSLMGLDPNAFANASLLL